MSSGERWADGGIRRVVSRIVIVASWLLRRVRPVNHSSRNCTARRLGRHQCLPLGSLAQVNGVERDGAHERAFQSRLIRAAAAASLLAILSQAMIARADERMDARQALAAQGVPFTEDQLFYSIQTGNSRKVELLLKAGINVRAKDPHPSSDGWHPIHLAAELGDLEIVKLLIKYGAYVDEPAPGRRQGLTPLLLASNGAVAKYLVEHGADVNRTGPRGGFTALHGAAASGDVELIELLLSKQAQINVASEIRQVPLETALKARQTRAAAFLIDKGADISGERGASAMALAARYGHTEIVGMLIERGVSVQEKEPYTDSSWTPLHWAARNGHDDIVRMLIANGSDVNARSSTQATPILAAAWWGNTDIVALLLQNGAEVNSRDNGGRNALYNALDTGARDTALLLLRHGAAINIVANEGQTPLMAAARHGLDDVVKLLLNKGANAGLRDHDGRTAHGLAVVHRKYGSAAVLSDARRK